MVGSKSQRLLWLWTSQSPVWLESLAIPYPNFTHWVCAFVPCGDRSSSHTSIWELWFRSSLNVRFRILPSPAITDSAGYSRFLRGRSTTTPSEGSDSHSTVSDSVRGEYHCKHPYSITIGAKWCLGRWGRSPPSRAQCRGRFRTAHPLLPHSAGVGSSISVTPSPFTSVPQPMMSAPRAMTPAVPHLHLFRPARCRHPFTVGSR